MEKRRSINTKFWEDSWIETLDPKEKLIFLYLLTSPLSNILGIYQITLKRISFDTGLTEETVLKALKVFESVKKIFYFDNYVFLVNHLKNQSLNPNMKKGVVEIYKNLPNLLKDKLNINALEGFESLSNGLGKYEKEVEDEEEKEVENESEHMDLVLIDEYSFENFWNLYDKKVGDKIKLQKKYYLLSKEEKEKIFNTLPEYVKSTPEKKFRKMPETYLNNKSWNDEIIYNGNTNKMSAGESRMLALKKLSDACDEHYAAKDRNSSQQPVN